MGKAFVAALFGVCIAIALGLYFGGQERGGESKIQTTATVLGEFGGVSLMLELSDTPEKRARGLGGREILKDTDGMLFIFPEEGRHGIWMENMRFPIDIFWLDAQGQVVSVSKGIQPGSYPNVFYPEAPALYVLETISGFTEAYSIEIGSTLVLQNLPRVSE